MQNLNFLSYSEDGRVRGTTIKQILFHVLSDLLLSFEETDLLEKHQKVQAPKSKS